MDFCKHCGKELSHVPGRKKKAFCDTNCRNKYFYAAKKGVNPIIEDPAASSNPQAPYEFHENLTGQQPKAEIPYPKDWEKMGRIEKMKWLKSNQ